MLNNLLHHFYNTPSTTVQSASLWYWEAHNALVALAHKYILPPQVVCAICAVLSPGLVWEQNVIETEKICRGIGGKHTFRAYRRNVEKAIQILITGNTDLVKGPKVNSFYHNLLDPNDPQYVTVDKRAAQLWGYDFRKDKYVRPYHYNHIANDYKTAASTVGLLPNQFQAVLWMAARTGQI